MTKVDFSTPIRDIRGNVMKEFDGNNQPTDKPVTLAAIVCTALLAQHEDERNLSGKEKVKRFKLAEKVADGGEQDLKSEDITEIKKLVEKGYGALIVGRVHEIIDPDPDQKINGKDFQES